MSEKAPINQGLDPKVTGQPDAQGNFPSAPHTNDILAPRLAREAEEYSAKQKTINRRGFLQAAGLAIGGFLTGRALIPNEPIVSPESHEIAQADLVPDNTPISTHTVQRFDSTGSQLSPEQVAEQRAQAANNPLVTERGSVSSNVTEVGADVVDKEIEEKLKQNLHTLNKFNARIADIVIGDFPSGHLEINQPENADKHMGVLEVSKSITDVDQTNFLITKKLARRILDNIELLPEDQKTVTLERLKHLEDNFAKFRQAKLDASPNTRTEAHGMHEIPVGFIDVVTMDQATNPPENPIRESRAYFAAAVAMLRHNPSLLKERIKDLAMPSDRISSHVLLGDTIHILESINNKPEDIIELFEGAQGDIKAMKDASTASTTA